MKNSLVICATQFARGVLFKMLIYLEFMLSIFESWHVERYRPGAHNKNKPLKTGPPSPYIFNSSPGLKILSSLLSPNFCNPHSLTLVLTFLNLPYLDKINVNMNLNTQIH